MNQLQTGQNGFQVRQAAMSRYCAVCRLFALAALWPLVSAIATASPPEGYDYDLPRAEDEVERCAWVGPSPGEEVFYAVAIDVPSSDVARAFGPTERIVCRIHVIRRSDGSGGFDEALIPKMMQDLNYGFRDTPVRFVREPTTVYIDNDIYYADFPTFQSAFTMLNDHFETGVMSWYITPNINGAVAGTWIGGAFDGRGILMAYFTAGSPANIVTAPHEMGHIFQVHHPYLTVFGVECTSGSNCLPAGDLVCDTPASPLVFGGSANGNTTATGIFYRNIPGPCAGDPPYAPRTDLYMEAGWAAGHILRDQWTRGQLERMDDHLFGNGVVWPVDDLIGPDRPDFLVDCDGNGLDDMDEILAGTKVDLGQDMVPDVCQALPAVGDLVVTGMTSVRTNRPRFYDGQTGAWRGDLWNGMTWAHQVRRGPDGLIYMARLTIIQRISTETARTVDNFIDGILEGAGTFVDLLFEPSGDILVLDNVSRNIRRYSGTNGTFLGQFMHLNTTGMTSPKYMEYGLDGRIYVVGNASQGNTIQRIDQDTGQTLGSFITPGAGGLIAGQGLVFHTDGMLYVSNGGGNNVLRYNGTTGAFDSVFVSTGSGGLSNPHSLRFGPDGHLYVASRNTNSVKRYDGTSGAYMGDFVAPGSGGSPGAGGLNNPTGLLFVEEVPTGSCCFNLNSRCEDAMTFSECHIKPGSPNFLVAGICTGDVTVDCPCSAPAAPTADLIAGEISGKNRFLSFSISDRGPLLAVRVTFDSLPRPFDPWDGSELWVGPTSLFSERGSGVLPVEGFPNFTAAALQCEPFYADWSLDGIIHVHHEGIVPGGTYRLDVIEETCNVNLAASFSTPLSLATPIWGDTVLDLSETPPLPADGAVNVVDALGVLGRFASDSSSIIKARADLEPGCVDFKINVTDVLASLAGFVGLDYPFAPSAPDPCDATCPDP